MNVLLPPRQAAPSRLAWLPLLGVALAVGAVAQTANGRPGDLPGDLAVIAKWLPLVFSGFLFNVLVSLLSMALGTALGVPLGLLWLARARPVRAAGWTLVQFFRNAPWLVLLFYIMFLLPFELQVFGLRIPLPAWAKAVIGLSLPVAANVAEIVRGGVQSIPEPQWSAADSLAFSRFQTLWMVILPQALRRMLPPWMNLYAILTMATTLISVVGIQDGLSLTRAAIVAEARPELMLPMYGLLLLMFFAYCYPIARLTGMLERRVAVLG